MKRYLLLLAVTVSSVLIISGCSTVPKKVKKEMEGLSGRVDTLESRVETVEGKQAELEMSTATAARSAEARMYAEPSEKAHRGHTNITPKRQSSAKKKAETREIQTCLKNANFYQGEIDGIKGKATRRAIREFQKANGLNADGVVGPKTWALLSKHASSGEASVIEKETVK